MGVANSGRRSSEVSAGRSKKLKSELEASNRQLHGQIEKTIFVHRVHFETEFTALKDIYSKLAKTRRDMSSLLRPMFSVGNRDATDEEKFVELQRNFKAFATALD